FHRVEETVRNLLQNQGALDQTAVDTVDIMKVYKGKLSEGVKKPKEVVEDLNLAAEVDYPSEGSGNEEEKDKTTLLLERLRALEAENSALTTENETQRQQYERCLDEDLREECLKLRTRVFDLEQQNRTLSVLFQQRVRPASDLLLQRLHSRIMDLSAGDLLSEPERSKSFLQLRTTETDIHESQQNVKSEIPVFKCQSQLGLTVPTQLYPRSSCSSSELSLSSACSEYSSGSYTWNDGKLCSKRSSLNWEKRVSIGSSAPNVSSPAKEQLPTRRKESHILEGLKKLQKRKPMEPPSLISKWGYKDCMNSNEGIYSPGIKCVGRGAPKSHLPNKPVGMCMSRELGKKIAYDYDSHDDADDESTNTPTLPYDLPSKDCRTFCKKLSHSVSDSLFSWGHSGKSMMGRKPSYFNSARPEKLTSFINGLFLSEKTCTSFKPPVLKFKASPTDLDCALQLSDIDDLEVLEDLHVESGDDTSSKVNQLAEKRAKGGSNRLSNEFDKLPLPQCEKDLSRSSQLDSRPKTFNLMKQNKVVRKTSSEECITVIFDAEDGEPIELSSHQTGVVSVTRNEISVNQQQTISTAEYTELIPHGMANCQKGSNVRNYSVLESPQNKAEQQPDNMAKKNVILSSVCTDTPSSERLLPHIPQQPKLIKPAYNNAHKLNYVPSMQTASSQRTNLTKIPSSGKGSPQKVSKTSASETSNNNGTSSSSCQEKSPSSPPVKLSRFIKSPGGGCNQSPKAELVVSKHNAQSQQSSKIPCRNDWGKGSYTGVPGSPLLPRRHMESVDYGEPPTRDRNCDPGQAELRVDKTENGSNHVSYRSMSKGSSQDSSLPTISISTQGNHKKMNADMEMHNETVTKIVTQKINIMADDDEETIPKPSCQDHMLGIMKPKGVHVKKLNPVGAKSPDSDEKQAEKRKNSQDQSSLQTDRMLLESTYSASSSDSETESESNEIGTGQEVLLDQMKNNTQVDQDEHAVKKSCIVSPMSIMDFYQHKVYVHYGKERHKDMSQYSFVHNQSITEGKAGDSPSVRVALQIQCYQCEEFEKNECSSPENIVNCTVNVQDMCQKEVVMRSDGVLYRKSCATSAACLIASSGYQSFCAPGKVGSVCISCCNTPLCNGPRQRRRGSSAAAPATRLHVTDTLLPFLLVVLLT
ncbi:Nck-associated protein 5, partial [Acipenser ruthenus]